VVLTLAISLLPCGPALAQGLDWGARAGINLATVSSEGEGADPGFDTQAGLLAGGFVTWRVGPWLEVQPEVLYSAKGAKVEADGVASTLRLDYLEVPVLAKFPFGALGRRLYAAAGPAVGVRLRARSRAEFSGATEEVDVSDLVARTDFGIALGGGVEVGPIAIDGRYTFGLSDLDTADDVTVRNRVVSVSAGFRF
jgi:hypothetical protein